MTITTCPHCTQSISIGPETLASLQGSPHFACPACSAAVPVPPPGPRPVAPVRRSVEVKTATPRPAPSSRANLHRGMNRNLLVLGSVALLVLGGLAAFIASRKSGNVHNTRQNIHNEIINNTYFQQLIASGATTEKDLNSIAEIRPYGEGFIGISAEELDWTKATGLAKRSGSQVLSMPNGASDKRHPLLEWLNSSYPSYLLTPVWVSEGPEPRILDGPDVMSVTGMDRQRKVLLQWNLGDTVLVKQAGTDATTPRIEWPVINHVPKERAGRLIAVSLIEGVENSDPGFWVIPPEVAGLTNIVRVARAGKHALALDDQGQLHAFEYGTETPLPLPESISGKVRKVVQIIAGYPDAVLLDDGSVLLNESGTPREIPSTIPFTRIAGTSPHLYGFDSRDRITYIGPPEGKGKVSTMDVPETVKGRAIRELKGSRTNAMAWTADGDVVIWGHDGRTVTRMPKEIQASFAHDPVSHINMDSEGEIFLTIQDSGKVNFWGSDAHWYDKRVEEIKGTVNSWQSYDPGTYWDAFILQARHGGKVEYKFIEKDVSRSIYLTNMLMRHDPIQITSLCSIGGDPSFLLMIVPP